MERKDFDRFINDPWRSKHPIPPNYPSWGSMTLLRRRVAYRLRSLFLHQPTSSPLSILYHSALSFHDPYPFLQSHFLEPLAQASSWSDLVSLSQRFRQDNLYILTDWYPSENPYQPTHYIPTIELPVLTFHDKDYYFHKKYSSFRKHFLTLIKSMIGKLPYSAHSAYRIELFLAKLSSQSSYSPNRYKILTRKQLEQQPFPWKIYWNDHPEIKKFLVECPAFYTKLQHQYSKFSLDEWKAYFLWRILFKYSFSFSQKQYQRKERFFHKNLYGQPQSTPFWKTIVHILGDVLPYESGQLYHRKYGSKQAEKQVHQLAEEIRASTQRHIQQISWLSPTTKKRAQKKLSNMLFLIGSSQQKKKPLYLPSLDPNKSFMENLCLVAHHQYQKDLKKKKVHRQDWNTSASHNVNAFYDPHQNRMIIPDGILQAPFYSKTQSLACLYGSLGKIVGHEIVHAFDTYGRRYDEDCFLRPWWTQKEIKYYKKETNKIKDIYNRTYYKNRKIDGDLTQGENIADWGALPITLDAYQQVDPHLSTASLKQFFICYAKSRRFHYRMKYLDYLLQEDPHAPHPIRVNMVLASLPAFKELFSITKNSPMYINQKDLPKIW